MTEALPEPVAGLLEAANANDVDGFLATFIEDGVVDGWGREFVGLAAIRSWSDREFIGKRVSLDVRGVERDGDATVVAAEVGGNGFNGPSHLAFYLTATGFRG